MTTLSVNGGCSGNDQKDMRKREMIFVVLDAADRVLVEKRESDGTNNISELLAIREALAWAAANGISDLKVVTDSRSNLAWANGKIGKSLIDRDRVKSIYEEIVELRQCVEMTLVWVPRQENPAGFYLALSEVSFTHSFCEHSDAADGAGV
jgi:ribonuclease HI